MTHAYRTDDGNRVIVTHTFNTLEEAQKYKDVMESPDGWAMLEQNGAEPPFTVWVAKEIDM